MPVSAPRTYTPCAAIGGEAAGVVCGHKNLVSHQREVARKGHRFVSDAGFIREDGPPDVGV